ncbi:hypothetical protein H6G17_09105 [Chroococcidiopsis sp. FACHB-1243]|uniref:hypothetical protein n=1 Tax=Chroococcidiopsis sp. [FACHB-1243] TaxID=2692781 RepID=UPI00177E1212|nr:hypothetical protein [Chroococcidiopsis sp. [FACHB-1243]]MBD2305673.1 hypothetical protein [Chroococcidiopsis sp. [FACHB-1243]]
MPPVDQLVAQLVQERSQTQMSETQQHSAAATPRLRQLSGHEWRHLEKEPIYLLKLTVKVGVQSLKLDGSHLGIGDDVLRLLESEAKGGYAAKINHRLKDAATKLQARQKIIYNRYTLLSEPFRFVHESVLPDALEAIEGMMAEADSLRQGILATYESEYAGFLSWVEQVLKAAALEPKAIELALRQYAGAYPTQKELQVNSLQILVEGPIKIPSLLERSEREAEVQRQQAEAEVASVERQKLKLIERSQQTLQQTLISTLYDAQIRSRDEADAKLAQLLESFNLSGADATSRTGQKWDTLIARLQVLMQYDCDLEPVVERARQLGQLYRSDNPDLERVQQHLEDFRAMLKQRVQQQNSTGEGLTNLTKALALDAGYSELLRQLEAIAQQPDPEQLRQLKGKLASMENLFKFRTKDLLKRWEIAEAAVRQSLGLEATAKTKDLVTAPDTVDSDERERHDSIDRPYDPEAGF